MVQTVVHFTDSPVFGGAEQALLTLLGKLDPRVWRAVLVHHPEPELAPLAQRARQLGVEVRSVPRRRGEQPGEQARQFLEFVRLLRSEDAAVFHAHLAWPLAAKYGILAAAAARIPAIVATEQLFIAAGTPRGVALQRLAGIVVDRYIAVSHHVARSLRTYLAIPKRKLRVVHNAVDLGNFDRPGSALELPHDPTDGFVVLTVARLHEQKGLPYLLAAAAMVPQARFLVAGEGPERVTLERQAHALGLDGRVRFLGYREDVGDLLERCDAFVLPSINEGLPISVLEAMAAGRPVVATNVGGTAEAVLEGETGLLVPPANPNVLAQAIRTLADSPPLAHRFGAAGRTRAQARFGSERMVQHVTGIYHEILDSNPGWRRRASHAR